MKIFRILGIALTAVIMCVNFTSCSKDDDDSSSSSSSSSGSDIPNNTIRYQTNDGVIIRFENEDVFGGAIIISNTYSTTKGYGTIEFASEVTAIEERAFYKCTKLTSITIPNSVTSIGEYAFKGCSDLTSVSLGNSVTRIRVGAFAGSGLTSVTIPNSVTSIESAAFDGCSGLTSIKIPNSVTYIGAGVFWGCKSITSIVVNKGNSVYDSRNNCNAIIETSTNELVLGCKTTKIPNSVTSIGGTAFYGCSGLTSIEIPNSVTSIGSGAFYDCFGLTSVTIPNSVTSIGYGAFEGCDGLTSVTIPNSVTSIGTGAFYKCTNLKEVYVLAGSPPVYSVHDPFSSRTYEKGTLYVPEGSVSLYKSTSPWSSFSNIKAIPKK